MPNSRYHSVLRVSALATALLLVFDSGMLVPVSKQFSDRAVEYLASSVVGVFAGVQSNELNEITGQLTQKERELDAREAALKEREIAARDFGASERPDYSTYVLSAILFVLTVLILLNYALDWARVRNLYAQGKIS